MDLLAGFVIGLLTGIIIGWMVSYSIKKGKDFDVKPGDKIVVTINGEVVHQAVGGED